MRNTKIPSCRRVELKVETTVGSFVLRPVFIPGMAAASPVARDCSTQIFLFDGTTTLCRRQCQPCAPMVASEGVALMIDRDLDARRVQLSAKMNKRP